MASFTESATLKVIDQSSAQIAKINAEIKKLIATAKSLKGATANLKINTGNLQAATRQMQQLHRAMMQMRGGAVNVRVNMSGLNNAARRIAQLHAQARQPVTVNVRGAGVGAGAGTRGPAVRRGGTGQYASGAIPGARGFMSGLGLGFGGYLGGMHAVEVAGFAAAAALSAVAKSAYENAAKRNRTDLQSAVTASKEQREVFKAVDERRKAAEEEFNALPPAAQAARRAAAEAWEKTPETERKGEKPFTPTALPMTKTAYDQLRTSLLGDVQSPETERYKDKATDTAEEKAAKEVRRAQFRAQAASNIADYLEKNVLPRIYAQAPEKGPEQAQEGLRKIVQAVNLGSADIVDTTGQFSKDGLRVLKGCPQRSGDPVQLQQVLLNLIMTAMDAMASTPVAQRFVVISSRATPTGAVQVRVKDRGAGIQAVDQGRLFEPFYTTKTNGLGLGLAICSAIAEAHGGSIKLGNDDGGGAVARLSLPASAMVKLTVPSTTASGRSG